MKLYEIIDSLKNTCEKSKIKPSDDTILKVSMGLYLNGLGEDEHKKDNSATVGQVDLLKKLKVNVDYTKLTKQEADKLIKEKLNNEK